MSIKRLLLSRVWHKAFALDTGRYAVLATLDLGEDAALLYPAREALEGDLERITLSYHYL